MPSTLAWNFPQQVSPVYGEKRKAVPGGDDMDMQGESEAKRRCQLSGMEQGQGDYLIIGEAEMIEDAAAAAPQPMQQQPPIKTWCTQVQTQQMEPRSPSPWPSHPSMQQQPIQQQPQLPLQHCQEQPQPQQQYIMNINDEVYSPGDVCFNLDSDPNQIYSVSPPKPSTSRAVGDYSSTSDLARCYCRPNWDGDLNSLKPYVSDIY